jgi:hypothetical protein
VDVKWLTKPIRVCLLIKKMTIDFLFYVGGKNVVEMSLWTLVSFDKQA